MLSELLKEDDPATWMAPAWERARVATGPLAARRHGAQSRRAVSRRRRRGRARPRSSVHGRQTEAGRRSTFDASDRNEAVQRQQK